MLKINEAKNIFREVYKEKYGDKSNTILKYSLEYIDTWNYLMAKEIKRRHGYRGKIVGEWPTLVTCRKYGEEIVQDFKNAIYNKAPMKNIMEKFIWLISNPVYSNYERGFKAVRYCDRLSKINYTVLSDSKLWKFYAMLLICIRPFRWTEQYPFRTRYYLNYESAEAVLQYTAKELMENCEEIDKPIFSFYINTEKDISKIEMCRIETIFVHGYTVDNPRFPTIGDIIHEKIKPINKEFACITLEENYSIPMNIILEVKEWVLKDKEQNYSRNMGIDTKAIRSAGELLHRRHVVEAERIFHQPLTINDIATSTN